MYQLNSRPSRALIALAVACISLLCGCNDSAKGGQSGDEATLDTAAKALKIYDFDKAYKLLTPIQHKLEVGTPLWDKVTYTLALAAWHKSPPNEFNIGEAVQLFEALIAHSESKELVASASIDLGRVYEVASYPGDKVELDKAQALYKKVIESEQGNDYGYQAAMRLAQTYVQQMDKAGVSEGIRILRTVVYDYPESPWKAVAAQYLGDLYAENGPDYAKALECYQITKELGFPVRSKADIYVWRMGIFAERSDQPRLAMDYFNEVVTKYPRSIYGTFARDRIADYLKEHPDEKTLTVPELGTFQKGSQS